MKKILFAVMLCCVAMTSALLSSCEQPKPNKPFDETVLLGVLDPYLVWGCSADDVQKHIEAKPWWKPGNDSLEHWEGLGWHRWYEVSDSLTEQYLFETEAGENLLAVECYSYHANLPMSAARAYLEKSGFVFMSSHYSKSYERDIDMFLSSDHLTRAFIYPWDYRNNRWFIYYEPASAAN